MPYIRLTQPQWAPRLGFSWDVYGDSTLKIFGNAGRYYLAVPLHTAMAVTASTYLTNLYGTYTGIDQETGEPIGFKPLPQNPSTGVSVNNQYGQAKDPRSVAAENLKAQYSDNFVLGMQQAFEMLGTKWVFGVTGTYQKMDRILDDYADFQRMCAAGRKQGYDWMTPGSCANWTPSLLLINPGETAHVQLGSPDGGLVPVVMTKEDQGFKRSPKRQYYSIDFSLGHQWDGKWALKIDYLLSRTWGNTQGPVSTYSQQSGTNLTTDWDFPERMEYSYGDMPGDRRHQIKIYGAYGINEEWTIGANAYITSGTPRLCRGYYGPNQTSLHGSSTFHWCGGKPAPPGSLGRTPWVHELNLNVDYKPAWAGHKLDFNLAIFRVFNGQTPTFYNDFFLGTANPNPDYAKVQSTRPARTVRLSVSYNY